MITVGSPRFQRLAKEGLWVVAGQAASVAGSLALVRVLTESLDPLQYGELALALTLGTLISQVAFSGAMPGIMRFYTVAVEKADTRQYLVESLRLMLFGTAIALGLASVLMGGLVLAERDGSLGLVGIAIVFAVLANYNSTLSMIQNAARQRHVVAIHNGLEAWLKVLIVAALLACTTRANETALAGYLLSLLIVLASQSFFIRPLIPPSLPQPTTRRRQWSGHIWLYSRPFVVFNMFTWLQASSDRWALETFATTAEVGLYAVLMQLGYAPISMVAGLVTTFLSPILFQRSGDATEHARNASADQLAWQVTFVTLVLTAIGVLLAILFHEWIFRLVVAQEYRFVSHLLPWFVLAGGLFAAGQMISLKLMSGMNTKALLAPKVVTAIAGTLLSFVGANIAGLEGVVTALVAFSALHLLYVGFVAARPKPSRTSLC